MKRKWAISLLLTAVLWIAGCMEAGMISQTQTFNGRDSLTLETPKENILDIITEVGKSMGFRVSQLSKGDNVMPPMITLSSQSSMMGTMLIGSMSGSDLTVMIQEGGKKIDISISAYGNFGSGGQEAATKIMDDFKSRLLQRLTQP